MNKFGTLCVSCALLASTTAFAWGQREQAALAGLVVGAALTTVAAGENNTAPPTIIVPQPQFPVAVQPVYTNPPVYAAPTYSAPQQLVCGVNVVCPGTVYPTYRPTCTQVPIRDVYGRFYRWETHCF